MKIILAPHADDEIIGCYSVLSEIDQIIFFKEDYRSGISIDDWRYCPVSTAGNILNSLTESDTIYLPSHYDLHPLHRKVRRIGLAMPGKKMFYSVEMNTPWMEEEEDPKGKKELFCRLYPGEVETICKNDKYFLFKSIKPFDEIIWSTIRFQREFYHRWPAAPERVSFLSNLHRHLFHFEAKVQQFGDDRDLEYFILSRKIQQWWDTRKWSESTSCEMFALAMKQWLEVQYPDRLVQTSVFEDGENGACIE